MRTKEEAKARGRNGGIKSGEARRRKRDAKSAAKLILDMGVASPEIRKMLKSQGIADEDFTNRVSIMARAYAKAMSGDIKAMQFLIEMAGEAPKQRLAVDQFEYRKEKDAGVTAETEDLDEIEEEIYGSQED